jgi:bacterioferritin
MITQSPSLIDLLSGLNEDISRELQAAAAYAKHAVTLKGAGYQWLAEQLSEHGSQEYDHAKKIAYWVDFLGGNPTTEANKTPETSTALDIIKADIQSEKDTIIGYKERVKEALALEEYALVDDLKDILVDESDHINDLATAINVNSIDLLNNDIDDVIGGE